MAFFTDVASLLPGLVWCRSLLARPRPCVVGSEGSWPINHSGWDCVFFFHECTSPFFFLFAICAKSGLISLWGDVPRLESVGSEAGTRGCKASEKGLLGGPGHNMNASLSKQQGSHWPLQITGSQHWNVLKVIQGTTWQSEARPQNLPKRYLRKESNNYFFLGFSTLQKKEPFLFSGVLKQAQESEVICQRWQ